MSTNQSIKNPNVSTLGAVNKLRRLNPEVHALLERIFQYKDGKGDYSVDRYRWLETFDEETFLNEIHQ